jgi:Fur family ferric uptake transcriptional regulator
MGKSSSTKSKTSSSVKRKTPVVTKAPAAPAARKVLRAEELLQSTGLSRTQARLEILQRFLADRCIQSVEDIHRELKDFDLATIYRSIAAFEEAGLIRKIQLADGLARYELNEDDHHGHHHHHHIICRLCKRIEVIDHCLGEELDKLASKMGFSDVHHSLEFYGVCRNCAAHPG